MHPFSVHFKMFFNKLPVQIVVGSGKGWTVVSLLCCVVECFDDINVFENVIVRNTRNDNNVFDLRENGK